MPDGGDGSLVGFSQRGLALGEDLLDRVQVRAVGWQEEQMGTGPAYGAPDGLPFVAAEIVEHDDVAPAQRWGGELSTQARKRAPLIGPSNTQGATMPSARSAARKVIVVQCACGTAATRRLPRRARPCVRVMLVSAQVSSMKTRRAGSPRAATREPVCVRPRPPSPSDGSAAQAPPKAKLSGQSRARNRRSLLTVQSFQSCYELGWQAN